MKSSNKQNFNSIRIIGFFLSQFDRQLYWENERNTRTIAKNTTSRTNFKPHLTLVKNTKKKNVIYLEYDIKHQVQVHKSCETG